MAKRFTDTGKFKDIWYRKLSPKYKCIWEFAISECDHAGFLDVDLESMTFHIGEEITEEDLNSFGDRFVFVRPDVIFIPKFIKYQYGKLNPENKVHKSVLLKLEEFEINIAFKPLDNPLEGAKEKENKNNMDMKKEENNTKKINDSIFNPYKSLFESEYKKMWGQKPILMASDCNKILELASDIDDFGELIPGVIKKLRNINFNEIGFKPSISWLLKENNFAKVANGEFDKRIEGEIEDGTNY